MATYLELHSVAGEGPLLRKITVAVAIAAEAIRTEDPATVNHADRMRWVKSALIDPDREARKMVWALLAQNANATVSQIQNVTDSAVQTAVDNAISLFI